MPVRESDAELPEDRPRSLKTDADGPVHDRRRAAWRLRESLVRHPDYAVDEVTVSTVAEMARSRRNCKGFEIVPVKPSFTHTLEPARPVQVHHRQGDGKRRWRACSSR